MSDSPEAREEGFYWVILGCSATIKMGLRSAFVRRTGRQLRLHHR